MVVVLAIMLSVAMLTVSARSQIGAAALYKTKCAACHAADGSGGTAVGKTLKVRNLRDPEVQKQADAQLQQIIAKGKEKMPAYEQSLKADEIRALVAYIRELGKTK